MTDNDKIAELFKEIGELIMQKNIYINTREFTIQNLTRKLELAEKEIEELRKAKSYE